MQTLEIISINLWHVLISLANLILLFLIVKRFLFKPVMNLFEQRKAELDGRYAKADEAQRQANEAKAEWEAKLLEYPELFNAPSVRNGKEATVGYCPEVWAKWE